eukprot:jgi/Mesen1/5271/ME000263S04376
MLKDIFVSEKRRLADHKRLYPPGTLYHVVCKEVYRCGRQPFRVLMANPHGPRFEKVVISLRATADHHIRNYEAALREAAILSQEMFDDDFERRSHENKQLHPSYGGAEAEVGSSTPSTSRASLSSLDVLSEISDERAGVNANGDDANGGEVVGMYGRCGERCKRGPMLRLVAPLEGSGRALSVCENDDEEVTSVAAGFCEEGNGERCGKRNTRELTPDQLEKTRSN